MVFALVVVLFAVLLDAGRLEEEDSLLRDCRPPTTPPMIATASMIAKIRPRSSQKCFCRRPQILFSGDGAGSRPSSTSLGPTGDIGLRVPSGDVGIPMGMPACASFSLR